MKRNRIFRQLLLGLLLCLPALPVILPSCALAAEGGLVMSVTYGYDNHVKGGRYVPVDVELVNESPSGFSGALQFLTMESDYDIYRYEYPAAAAAGETADFHMYIPLGNRSDQMFVTLTDEEGQKILHKRINLNFNLDMPELFIGVLSDTPEKLSGWDGIGVDYSMLKTVLIPFETESFPTDTRGLDMIDVLLISNYRIRDLSQEQSQVLVEWVRSGGVMILGTGMRADDTLGRFAPELLEESYDPPVVREVNMGDAYAVNGPSDATFLIPCLEFSLSGGDVLFYDEQQTLAATAAYGRGRIAVAAYDFTDIDEFCRQTPAYLDDLLSGVLGESRLLELSQEVYSGNSGPYWSVRDMINTGNVRQLPNLSLYALELTIYIFLAGLALYIFLKQRDLTDYYRRCVGILALLFTAIIYVMGSRTRFTDTIYTYARFLETTYDSVFETSYMNIRAPYNRPYRVNLPAAYSIKPITRSYYNDENVPRFTGSEDYRVELRMGEEETELFFQDVPAFEPRYFQLYKVTGNEAAIGFDGEVEVREGKLSGNVTNQFPAVIEDCALLFNHKLIVLGDMEPGETVVIDDLEVLEYPRSNSYQVAAYLSGESAFEEADISSEEYVHASEKTNLLQFYLDNHMTYYTTPGARVIGVMREDTDGSPVKHRGARGITVVSSSILTYSADDEIVYRSGLVKTPRVLGGNYDAASNSTFGIDPVTLEYFLGSEMEIEEVQFDYVSEAFTGRRDLVSFSGNIYFYNYVLGRYDVMDREKTVYSGAELRPYLSASNAMTIRYVYENASQYSFNVLLPMLSVVGREH